MQFSAVMQLTLKTVEQFLKIGFYFITFTFEDLTSSVALSLTLVASPAVVCFCS